MVQTDHTIGGFLLLVLLNLTTDYLCHAGNEKIIWVLHDIYMDKVD